MFRFLFIGILSCCLIVPSVAKNYPISIDEWGHSSAERYMETLASRVKKFSKSDIAASRERAHTAHKGQNYQLEADELERLVGAHPDQYDVVLELILAKLNLLKTAQEKWNLISDIKSLAIHAMKIAKDDAQMVRPLFAYLVASSDMLSHLGALEKLMPLKEFRKKYPAFAAVLSFDYESHAFDETKLSPTLNIRFSYPIDGALNIKDYVEVAPKSDVSIVLQNNQLVIQGFDYGKNYQITLKKGLKSVLEDDLKESKTINVYVPDQDSRLSFSSQAYILKKGDQNLVPLTTTNLSQASIEIYRVPERGLLAARSSFMRSYVYDLQRLGEQVFKGHIEINTPRDEQDSRNKTVVTQIDLNTLLKEAKPGLYVLSASPKDQLLKGSGRDAVQWLVVTDMALSAIKGSDGMTVEVRSLETAKPLENIDIELVSRSNEVLATLKSDKEGRVVFPVALLKGRKGAHPGAVVAQREGELSFLYLNEPAFDLTDRGVSGRRLQEGMDAYLYTDRGVYRGGETVHANVLLRDPLGKAVKDLPLTFRLTRPDGVVIWQKVEKTSDVGHVALDMSLVEKSRTGMWTLTAYMDPEKDPIGTTTFQIEDFVPTRLLVKLTSDQDVLTPSAGLKVDVSSQFLFGAKASNLPGKAKIRLLKHPNPFPKYQSFRFGLVEEEFAEMLTEIPFEGVDDDGKAQFVASLESQMKTSHPLQAVVFATLFDQGGGHRIGSLKRLAMTQPVALGLKTSFGEALGFDEKEGKVEFIAVNGKEELQKLEDVDYELVCEQVNYTWHRKNPYDNWEYAAVITDRVIQQGKISASEQEPVSIPVSLEDWGTYRLSVSHKATGAKSSLRFSKGYSSGLEKIHSPHRLAVATDKPSYKPGDEIKVHVTSPFEGQGRLIIANQKVLSSQNIALNAKGNDFQVKYDPAWGHGAYVIVEAFRPMSKASDQKLALLPKRAIGLSWVKSDAANTLDVSFELPQEIKPRQKFDVPVQVKNAQGKKVHLTLAAVDEGILQLTEFKSPAPEEHFFAKLALGIEFRDVYGRIIDPQEGKVAALRSGGDMDALSRNLSALSKRSFKIVSLYTGLVDLDGDGKGKVSLDIPSFNGQLRLMGVAFDEERMGSQSQQLMVRDPVVVEPSLPRFLNLGDEIKMPVSVFNVSYEGKSMDLTLATKGGVALADKEASQLSLDVEKSKNITKTIAIKAESVGDAVLAFKASVKDQFDINETPEITVKEGELADHHREMVQVKAGESYVISPDRFSSYRPGSIQASVTLYDKVPWDVESLRRSLVSYPYGCVEQLTSKGMVQLYAKSEGAKAYGERILRHLSEKQMPSGSFAIWGRGEDHLWLSAYAYHFMKKAKGLGYGLSDWTLVQTQKALALAVSQHRDTKDPKHLFGISYALNLLLQDEKVQPGEIRYFFDTSYKTLPNLFAKGLVIHALSILGDEGRVNEALEGLKDASTDEMTCYGSEIRNQAGLVACLYEAVQLMPKHDALKKAFSDQVESLGARVRNHKDRLSTSEMAWVIYAGDVMSQQAKSDQLTIKIDDKDQTITGRHQIDILPDKGLAVKNTSDQPLWVGLAYQGVPKEPLSAASKDLAVQREFYSLKGQTVSEKELNSGEVYVVVLSGRADGLAANGEAQILISDYLAAGLDIENPLLNSGAHDSKTGLSWLTDLSHTDHREMRDDRFVCAVTLKSDQPTFKVAYSVRATIPGTYKLPPVEAEDMYAPKRFARTSSKVINIAPMVRKNA